MIKNAISQYERALGLNREKTPPPSKWNNWPAAMCLCVDLDNTVLIDIYKEKCILPL